MLDSAVLSRGTTSVMSNVALRLGFMSHGYLVPRRETSPTIRGFELRYHQPLFLPVFCIRRPVKPCHLVVVDPHETNAQHKLLANLKRRGKLKQGLFALHSDVCLLSQHMAALDVQFVLVADDRVCGAKTFDPDLHVPCELERVWPRRQVGCDFHFVVAWFEVLWKPVAHLCKGEKKTKASLKTPFSA